MANNINKGISTEPPPSYEEAINLPPIVAQPLSREATQIDDHEQEEELLRNIRMPPKEDSTPVMIQPLAQPLLKQEPENPAIIAQAPTQEEEMRRRRRQSADTDCCCFIDANDPLYSYFCIRAIADCFVGCGRCTEGCIDSCCDSCCQCESDQGSGNADSGECCDGGCCDAGDGDCCDGDCDCGDCDCGGIDCGDCDCSCFS